MNIANVATLDIPVAMLIPLEQTFSHVSQFNILVYFSYFWLNICSLFFNPCILAELRSDDRQPEDSLEEPMEDLDIIYSPSF